MQKLILNVQGMSCSHCEVSIKKAVGAIEGVFGVEVNLSENTVTVEYDVAASIAAQIKEEIEEQGYDVI